MNLLAGFGGTEGGREWVFEGIEKEERNKSVGEGECVRERWGERGREGERGGRERKAEEREREAKERERGAEERK